MPKRSMPVDLSDGFLRFRQDFFQREHDLYEELADKGQHPHTLVIACSDSRADPAQVFASHPGEIFVVRNVANLVPECEPGGHSQGVSAAIEYAVTALEVPNILILGHKQCGGVAARVQAEPDPKSLFLAQWIEPIAEAIEDAKAALGADADMMALTDQTELCSIQRSMQRLLTYPFIAERVEAGTLKIHGARFGISDGELEWLTIEGDFAPVEHPD
ncbi:carbonic anhydrase [Hyphobacterium sp.]|uniref:carbonic anhydrase n=1 Tax=Hyphobacterium sp. TaxID=2004662 RepID=UPI003BAB2E92